MSFFIETKDLNNYLDENQSGIGSKTSAEKVSKLGLKIENLVQSEKGKFSDFFSLKGEGKIHCADSKGLLDFLFGSTLLIHFYNMFLFKCFKTQKKFVKTKFHGVDILQK